MREKWFLPVMTMYLKPWLLYDMMNPADAGVGHHADAW